MKPTWPARLGEFWRQHRRWIVGTVLLCGFFFVLGYFSPKVSSPLMCKIYG
jgi:cellulose synthase/poly-beta-1,6-N-acetylglucosamine synthase-like glycosyltransferase